MKMFLALSVLAAGLNVSGWAATVPPGTEITVTPDQGVNVSKWDRGRIYPGHVANDVLARDGRVAIPRGAYAEMIVRQTGPNELVLDLESVTVGRNRYALDTSGPGFNANNYNNGGGIIGNIVGAIAGVETRGQTIRVPAGSLLRFHTEAPLRVVDWPDPGYTERGYHYHRDHDWYR